MLPGVLLDTNVLSELMRSQPDAAVLNWFNEQAARIYTSTITEAEILLGIALLPNGKRRDALAQAAEQMFEEDFAGRCLPFDRKAAQEYALLVASRTKSGLPVTTEDAQIAAIALSRQLPLATRNTKDFRRIDGLVIINPWG